MAPKNPPRSLKLSTATLLGAAILGHLASAAARPQVRAGPSGRLGLVPTDAGSGDRRPEEIFRANCGTCHGWQGAGRFSWIDPSRFATLIAGADPGLVRSQVRSGRVPAMPSFPEAEITNGELSALANYVHGLPGSYVPPPPDAVTVLIQDEDPWFSPMQIQVRPGETVRFLNAGRTFHPVTELSWILSGGEEGIHSGLIGPAGAYYHTFAKAGRYDFLCGIHPYMRGEVHVGESFAPPTYSVHEPTPPPVIPGVGEVWVCAQFQDWPGRDKDGVVQVIDASTWTVTHTIPVGNNPHNIWFTSGGAEAVVTNWFDVNVSRIDASTKTLLDTCIAGAAPAHVIADYAGIHLYVTLEGSDYVQRFTQAAGPYGLCGWASEVIPPVARIGGFMPHGIWYTSGKIVTANSMTSSFSVIDEASLTEIATLPTGLYPLGASANVAGTLGATGNGAGRSVSVFDLVGLAHVRDIPLSYGALQAPFTPDDRYIVAANGSFVTVIDAQRAADPQGFPDPASAIVAEIWVGDGAHGVAFGPRVGGGIYAYVTHKFENYVSVVDLQSMAKAGSIPLVTTTLGKVSLAGSTDTGGNGVAVRPLPLPWN